MKSCDANERSYDTAIESQWTKWSREAVRTPTSSLHFVERTLMAQTKAATSDKYAALHDFDAATVDTKHIHPLKVTPGSASCGRCTSGICTTSFDGTENQHLTQSNISDPLAWSATTRLKKRPLVEVMPMPTVVWMISTTNLDTPQRKTTSQMIA